MGLAVEKSNVVAESMVVSLEEKELLEIYRKAKQMGFADINVTIQNGQRVKFWLTEKISSQ